MSFLKKSPHQEYPTTYTFGLTDEQLFLSDISRTLANSHREPLTLPEMALLYQLEPDELARFSEFVKQSSLSTDQLIDLVGPDEPLQITPPVEDLRFAMRLAGMDEQQARHAVLEHLKTRPGAKSGGFSFGAADKEQDREQ